MLFKEIVGRIDLLENVPVFYVESNRCTTVTYRNTKDKGIYLPNSCIDLFCSFTQQNSPVEFRYIKELIEADFVLNANTFATFNILHELGHWTQYKKYIDDGHDDCEFFLQFELDRMQLLIDRYSEAKHFKGKSVEEFNSKYSLRYLCLPTERYANDFAKKYMPTYCKDWRKEKT